MLKVGDRLFFEDWKTTDLEKALQELEEKQKKEHKENPRTLGDKVERAGLIGIVQYELSLR